MPQVLSAHRNPTLPPSCMGEHIPHCCEPRTGPGKTRRGSDVVGETEANARAILGDGLEPDDRSGVEISTGNAGHSDTHRATGGCAGGAEFKQRITGLRNRSQ